MKSKDKQIGGDHYRKMVISPAEFIFMNNISYMEGSAIKYLVRHRNKNGKEDLQKAIHFIEMLIDWEYTDKKNSYVKLRESEMDRKGTNK